ncbi:MAG: UDP-glucose 6-dehydrogenase [Candidatus Marinimicrobia bacterium]|nr:UDP-glucose 6-dehydrogenase [Candidatus Neomarinimicrobiota bacterium]|tara:strand:- start:763 stop:2085 length:1323 start_codon:yes stop_codon:yes gene_type:complete
MKKIGIIGTGYVGLVSGAGISDFGHKVICADIDKEKIKEIKKGNILIFEPGLKEIIDRNVKSQRLSFSSNIENTIKESDILFIAVGTPESASGKADLTYVENAALKIAQNLNSYKIICTKSTVPVGTGKKIKEIINKNKPSAVLFDYVSNPEFLREGSAVKDFLWPDRVLIGCENNKTYESMLDVYRPLFRNKKPIIKTDIATAEMVKYASNAFLALKISYINEIANLSEALGCDIKKVADLMGQDGRISPKFLHPGPGYGGSCFPKDTKALSNLAKQENIPLETVNAAIKANIYQKKRMFSKLKALLKNRVKGKTIAILGLSFKPNTSDIRESSAIEIIKSILKDGGIVKAFDPISNNGMKLIFPDIKYFSDWEKTVDNADCVVIMTEWNEFRSLDLKELKNRLKKPIIFDTRNIFDQNKLLELGFSFDTVGRKKIINY